MSAPVEDTSEVLTERADKHVSGMPRHEKGRASGAAPRPPALWTARHPFDGAVVDTNVWGAYPKGFIPWAARSLHVAPSEVLHMCSGSLRRGIGRCRVDLRAAALPDVRADATRLPFADATFAAVMIDPPYSVEYARDLYGVDYPRPSALLREASRVVRPSGRIGILHFLVPMPPKGCDLERVIGVTTGCGYRIRAWTIFVKDQESLFDHSTATPKQV